MDALSFSGSLAPSGWKQLRTAYDRGRAGERHFGRLSPTPDGGLGRSAERRDFLYEQRPRGPPGRLTLTAPTIALEDGGRKDRPGGRLDCGRPRPFPRAAFPCALRVRFGYPQLDLTGKLTVERSSGSAALDLESRDTDAAAVRRAVLAAGGEHAVVRRIFRMSGKGTFRRSASVRAPIRSPSSSSRIIS